MTRRFISQSVGRKLLVTTVAILAFVLVYEASTFDSRDAATSAVNPTAPAAGARLAFTATAYCKGTTTASGATVRTGIAASDPGILPVGSVVNITTDTPKYNGVYTIMDTGPKVQGRILDLYMWSCHEALAFGRKPVQVTVLRLGWNPNASSPSLVDRLFRRREAARATVLPPPQTSPSETATAGDAAEPAPAPLTPAVEPASAAPVVEEPVPEATTSAP